MTRFRIPNGAVCCTRARRLPRRTCRDLPEGRAGLRRRQGGFDSAQDAAQRSAAGDIPRRPLGRTGEQVSIIGVGGYHLGTLPSVEDAQRVVQEAVDAGVNFFDNAWEYHDGRSEEWLGRALEGRRDKVLLMTKVCTHGRGKAVAMQQLEQSLTRLRTDHLDVWQIHEVIYENDPDLDFAPDGVVAALDQAKQDGKVRFVGFTGHKSPAIHLRMLSRQYPFDTVQMPLNCFDATYRSFEQQVLPQLVRQQVAALGMKSLGGDGQPILHGVVAAEEALRYAMSLPVATTITGIDSPGSATAESGDCAGLHAHEPGGHAGPARALRSLCCGRTPGAVQVDQTVRRRGRAYPARLSTLERASVLMAG